MNDQTKAETAFRVGFPVNFDLAEAGDGQRLLVLRNENPLTFTLFRWRPDAGFEGSVCLNLEQMSPDRIADILRAGADLDGFTVLSDTLSGMIIPALKGEEIEGYTATAREALASFIRSELSPAAEAYLLTPKGQAFDPMEWLNFLTSGDREARLQAVTSFPIQAELVLSNDRIRSAVDARQEILPVLAEVHGLDKAAARRLVRIEQMAVREGLKSPKGPNFHVGRLHTAIFAARHLSNGQMPEAGINDVLHAAQRCINLSSTSFGGLGLGEAPLLRRFRKVPKDGWEKEAQKTLPALHLKSREISDYVGDTIKALTGALKARDLAQRHDMAAVSAAANRLFLKEDLNPEEAALLMRFKEDARRQSSVYPDPWSPVRDGIRSALAERMSVKDALENAERWHHVNARMRNRAMSTSGELEWEGLVCLVEIDGGLRARELTSTQALETQGDKDHEDHCVGGYGNTVITGRSLIFSIENAEGATLSTIEVSASVYPGYGREKPSVTFSNAQHKARRNTEPSPTAKRAAAELVSFLNEVAVTDTQRVLSYFDGLASNTGNLRNDLATVIQSAGVNLTNPTIGEEVLAAYREVLPKSLRDLDIDGWQRLAKAHEPPKNTVSDAAHALSHRAKMSALRVAVGLEEGFSSDSRMDEEKGHWIGTYLHQKHGVTTISASYSGCGDSGQMDELVFHDADNQPIEIGSDLERLRLYDGGLARSFQTILEAVLDRDAEAQGDYYNNDGGAVGLAYFAGPKGLISDAEKTWFNCNDPDEEDYDEEYINEEDAEMAP